MATSNSDKTPEEIIQDHGPFNKGVDPQWLSEEASETHYGRSIDHWREPASASRLPNLATNFSARFYSDSAYESMSHGANSIRSIPGSPILEYGNAAWPGSLPEEADISSNLLLGLELYQTPNQNQVLGKDARISSDKFLASSQLGYEQRTQDGEIQAEFQAESDSKVLALPDLEERYQPSQCHLSGCQKGYVFETFQSYQSHFKNVHSHAIWCFFPECPHPRPFATKSDLKRHKITKHGDQRPYECLRQDYVARGKVYRMENLRRHNRMYRSGQFESSEACAENTNSKHLNHRLYQDVQKSEESRSQNQGLAPTQSPGYADHRDLAEYMPMPPALNHSIVKISPISKKVAALGEVDIEPAKTEVMKVVNAICLPSWPSYTPPVKMGSPSGSAEVSFGTTSRPASDTACGSQKKLDTAEEALENSTRQHHLLSGRGLPATSSTEDKGQEISRCLERNSNSSEGGSTDMEDQELDSRGGFLGFDSIAECQDGKLDRMRQDLLQSVLDPRRQALVEKIMDEFWQIWDSDWSSGIKQCASQSPSSTGDVQAPQSIACSSTGTARRQKRQRQDSNERDENDGNDDDFPRRPTKRTLLSGKLSSGKKFACPFRKYNPAKYSINEYHTCALTGQDTISRLKFHLYRVHSTPPYCRRCWKTFANEGQLEAHATAPKEMICDSTLGQAPEGVTPQQAERLKSRGGPYANQSEHDRWGAIYKILFSHIEADNIPSPYFEEPQEQVPQTPTSQALQQYESYVHNTVPVRFQSLVEAAVRDVMEPVEATFLRNLDIIGLTRSCLEEASREYREKHRDESSSKTPAIVKKQPEVCQPYLETSTNTAAAEPAGHPTASINFLDEIMQPPPPQLVDYGLDNATIDTIRGNETQTDINNTSDSAYGSGPFCFCIGPCICWNFENDTQPHGWQIASSQRDSAGDGRDQTMRGQTVDLDGVEEIDWNSYLESQALFGLPGRSQLS